MTYFRKIFDIVIPPWPSRSTVVHFSEAHYNEMKKYFGSPQKFIDFMTFFVFLPSGELNPKVLDMADDFAIEILTDIQRTMETDPRGEEWRRALFSAHGYIKSLKRKVPVPPGPDDGVNVEAVIRAQMERKDTQGDDFDFDNLQ